MWFIGSKTKKIVVGYREAVLLHAATNAVLPFVAATSPAHEQIRVVRDESLKRIKTIEDDLLRAGRWRQNRLRKKLQDAVGKAPLPQVEAAVTVVTRLAFGKDVGALGRERFMEIVTPMMEFVLKTMQKMSSKES